MTAVNKTEMVDTIAAKGSLAGLFDAAGLSVIADAGEPDNGNLTGLVVDRRAFERLCRDVIDAVVVDTLEVVGLTLAAGEEVNLRGFGRFDPRDRKPVTRLNPATGEPIQVPAKRSVGFVPSPVLKNRLNQGASS